LKSSKVGGVAGLNSEREGRKSAKSTAGRCVFCAIVERRQPSNIVYEDEDHIAFLDIAPFSEGHLLVCPKKHGETVWEMDESEIGELFMLASRISRAVVSAVHADGFRFVQNNGEAANQVVAHVHVHVIPVKFADKGRFMERKKFTPEELTEIATRIRNELNRP
jgi:histidine triad (HIT) family protein